MIFNYGEEVEGIYCMHIVHGIERTFKYTLLLDAVKAIYVMLISK